MFHFTVIALATWRIANFLVNEDGPRDVSTRLRYAAGVRYDVQSQPYSDALLGEMLLCMWCTSFWVGVLVTLVYLFTPPLWGMLIFLPFALSAAAIGFHKFVVTDLSGLWARFSSWMDEGAEHG